jgi:hypothetical protein
MLMGFFRMIACTSTFRVFVLVLFWFTNAPVRTDAQTTSADLLLPDKPDYASFSEKGKALFNGLAGDGRYRGETIIVRMRPIAEVLTENRLQITIPGQEEKLDVTLKTSNIPTPLTTKFMGQSAKACYRCC